MLLIFNLETGRIPLVGHKYVTVTTVMSRLTCCF
ncbi:hypothetical protein NONO_c50040 [Nocardia nova SH22a]|uniref:Uncharacterized protein n=1 Tax=Nocardia nova SH22a TaxID=1415166 RepID=W5TLE7_9NOCA|nr:hypothetical protein NONO_c50040 [Nocardia nova SH22a]